MFLLVYGPHAGTPQREPTWRLHTNSINLGKTFLRIASIWKIVPTWILARVLSIYLLSFPRLKGFLFLFSMAWKWKPAKQWLIRSQSNCVTFPLRNLYNTDLKDLRRPDRLVLPLRRIRGLKIETFSGRRQLKTDVTSWFVRYCACSCSSPCRRGPVCEVKLVCLALWWKREHLTFISIGFVAFSNQNFADYRS